MSSGKQTNELKRALGLTDASALVVGTVIGTGVFLKSGIMSQQTGSPLWVMAAWLAAGVLSLLGALVYAELGGIFFNRGLIEGRFRDNLAMTGNLEYRLKIYNRLHWAFFVDMGNVFPRWKAIGPARAKVTGGTGMRYYVPPGDLLLARVDGGYSTEGFEVYLTFDHPF